HIPVLDAPLNGREEQVIAVTADPHRRRLRTAVRVDRGENRVVPAVEQLERRVTERDSHARKVTGARQQSAESCKAGKRAGPWRTELSSRRSGAGAKRRRSREFWQDAVGVVDPRTQQRAALARVDDVLDAEPLGGAERRRHGRERAANTFYLRLRISGPLDL